MRLIAYLDDLDLPVAGVLVGDRVHTLDRLAEDAGLREELALLDLRGLIAEDEGLAETRAALARALADGAGGVVVDDLRLVAPLEPGKIVCVGQNYKAHCTEQGVPYPDRPMLFAKFANAVVGDTEAIIRPESSAALDLEVELGVVIGKRARRVAVGDALAHVVGFVTCNDISARDLQGAKPALREGQRGDGQWLRAKGSDTFLPLGPCVVTADEIANPDDLAVRSWLTQFDGPFAGSGEHLMQDSRTSDMVFTVAELISFISANITLEPGDVVITGTPGGVGVFRDPPVFLQPGDLVRAEVEGIGSVSNPVVDHDASIPAGSPAAIALAARAARLAAFETE
jgi:2-keto-4-pentenoate hydratase/2-oxohepta-3-ene-1,7-dioic acid hydratase in catechol pathway